MILKPDLESNQLQGSPQWEKLLGFEPGEFTGGFWSFLERVHPQDWDFFEHATHLTFTSGQGSFEYRVILPNQSVRWLSRRYRVSYNANGTPVRMMGIDQDITEKKFFQEERERITSALAASEALFQSMNNNLPGVIYRYELYPDGSDAITYANSGSQIIWELPPEAVMQDCSVAWSQVHPDDVAGKKYSVQQSATHLTPWLYEWRAVNPSGRQIWVQAQAVPQRHSDGTIVWDGIILDITTRKQAEEALQESEIRYRRIVETTTEGVWIIDENNVTTFVNPQMALMLGYTPQEMLGQPIFKFMDEEGIQLALDKLEAHHQGKGEQYDFKLIRRDGSILWTIISVQPIMSETGQYQGCLGMFTDITDRKRAEDQLRQYERVVATTSDALAIVDRQYVYQMVNQAYLDLNEKQREEVINHTVAEVLGQEIFDQDIKTRIDQCLAGERVEYELWHLDVHGQPRFKSIIYVPYRDSQGEVSGLLASIRDLTEQRKAQDALLKVQAQYQRFLDTALEGFLVVDILDQGKVLNVNPAYCKMVGYDQEELLQMRVSDLEALENPEEVKNHIQYILKQGFDYFETHHRCKNGEIIDLAASVTYDPEEQILFSFVRDITKQNQAQAALRQSEIHLRTIINTTAYGILILDETGKICFVNDAAIDFFGRSESELLDSDFGIPICNGNKGLEIEIANSNGVIKNIEIRVSSIEWEGKPAEFVSLHDITDRKQIEENLRYQAHHDLLTGLPNRTFIMERLDYVLDCKKLYPDYYFALLFIDLDRFKIINDSLGHLVGDQLLVEVAKRLKKQISPFDTLARLSGDEFVVLLENVGDLDQAIEIAKAIRLDFHVPFEVENQPIVSTVSIGIAFSDHQYRNSLEVLRDADNAMYRAKSRGKDRYEVFDQTMHIQALRSLRLENDLRKAIENSEFRLYYQPIISLKTYEIVGVEALIRWLHPQENLIPPSEFIPVAEETGIIVSIGEWVLEAVCQQLLEWSPFLENQSNFAVSVNLSSRQLQLPDLCDRLDRIIDQYNINPERIKFEITETLLIDNLEYTTIIMEHFRQRRIRISIDDFGTGYSSLNYLHRLPIQTLKIDKSFVWEMEDPDTRYPIIEAIVTLAHALDMTVIAEGIELSEQMEILQKIGCEFGQGYLFSRPVLPETIAEFLQQKYLLLPSP